MTIDKVILRVILYVSFVLILLVSVTHVAWCFHSIDHTDTTPQSWWLAYACAVAIDLAIAAISLFLTNQKGFTAKGTGYTFVVGLVVLSWFSNWLYAKAHMDTTGIWSTALFGVQISRIAAVLYGSLPALVIAFSVMIDLFTGTHLTAAELTALYEEQKATELIHKKYGKQNFIQRTVNTGKELKSGFKELIQSEPTEPEAGPQDDRQTEPELITVGSDSSSTVTTEPLVPETPKNIMQFKHTAHGSHGSLKEQIEHLIRTEPGIKNCQIVQRTSAAKSYVSTVRQAMTSVNQVKVVN